ncbi:MAG: DUF2846 domain-containing protein [Sulfurimonas sp.]|jgi:hypothetical protein
MKKLFFIGLVVAGALFSGCATVAMEPKEISDKAKLFDQPTQENAGLYIYRDSILGAALKKDIWVDDKCVGESAPKTFFYEVVKGGQVHKITTESEFSPNDMILTTKGGKNYFVRQYIKMGAFVGGANLELVDEVEGKKAVSELEMAKKGNCSK